jgi:hypothetical protein
MDHCPTYTAQHEPHLATKNKIGDAH